jgi:hypothetical protein
MRFECKSFIILVKKRRTRLHNGHLSIPVLFYVLHKEESKLVLFKCVFTLVACHLSLVLFVGGDTVALWR